MGTKRPAQGELFKNNLHKIYIRRAGATSSSARTACDPELIVHFESFLKTYIILYRGHVGVEADKDLYVVLVDLKTWALAFLQWDLTEGTSILSQAVFTQSELDARNAVGDEMAKLECLNAIKREAITRAVLWMQNKDQDPWGYEVSPTDFSQLSVKESDMLQINKGFLKFNKIETLPSFLLCDPFESDKGGPPGVFKDPLTNKALQNSITQNLQSILALNEEAQEFSYEQVFETVCGLVMTDKQSVILPILTGIKNATKPAQILKELTLFMIPDLTDVFVGGVQFDKTELNILERRRSLGFAQMVRSLFRMLYRRYNGNTADSDPQEQNSKFKNFREDKRAAVLLLSITRLIYYMHQCEDRFESKAKEFNDAITNPFPNKSEMQEVYRVMKEVCPGKFEDEDIGSVINKDDQTGLTFEACIATPSKLVHNENDTSQMTQFTYSDPSYGNLLVANTPSSSNINQSNQASVQDVNPDFDTALGVNTSFGNQSSHAINKPNSSSDLNMRNVLMQALGSANSEEANVNVSGDPTGTWNSTSNPHSYQSFPSTPSPMDASAYTLPSFPNPNSYQSILSPMDSSETAYATSSWSGQLDSCNFGGLGIYNNSQQSNVQYEASPALMTSASSSNSLLSSITKQLKYIMRANESVYSSVILMDNPPYEFNLADLTTAYNAMQVTNGSKKDPLYEGGKELLVKMFTMVELENSNLKGRRAGEKKDSPQEDTESSNQNGNKNGKAKRGLFKDPDLLDRSNALLDVLPVLAGLLKQQLPIVPQYMNQDNVISVGVIVCQNTREKLKQRIFTEYRCQVVAKHKAPR